MNQKNVPMVCLLNLEYFSVDFIYGKWIEKGKIKYLVKWEKYSYSESTWEPLINLSSVNFLIASFEEFCSCELYRQIRNQNLMANKQRIFDKNPVEQNFEENIKSEFQKIPEKKKIEILPDKFNNLDSLKENSSPNNYFFPSVKNQGVYDHFEDIGKIIPSKIVSHKCFNHNQSRAKTTEAFYLLEFYRIDNRKELKTSYFHFQQIKTLCPELLYQYLEQNSYI